MKCVRKKDRNQKTMTRKEEWKKFRRKEEQQKEEGKNEHTAMIDNAIQRGEERK